MMRTLLLLILAIPLTLPALAQAPEETVKKVYRAHLTSSSCQDTIRQCESCFTPGFLGVMERALSKKRGGPGAFVDVDFFVNSQSGFPHFEVGESVVSGKEVLVPMYIWNDTRGYRFEKDPVKREQLAFPALVHLVDVGKGLQITNIEFLPHVFRGPSGKIIFHEGCNVRETLSKIANDTP